MRIKRSLDTCSMSSFGIAVILVREVPARIAIAAFLSLRTISLRRLSRACWTCHSFAAAADSPIALARSSGVLATIGLSLGIQKLLQTFSGKLNLQGRCTLGFLTRA